MTKNSGNAIKNRMIASCPKTDRQKLAGLEKYIHENHPQFMVILEPFIKFSKGEDKFIGVSKTITRSTFEEYNIKTADLFISSLKSWIFIELDGPIHDIKTEKTSKRNKRYELNNIPYIVINEAELKLKLGIPKSRKLTQEQINQEFDERLKEI